MHLVIHPIPVKKVSLGVAAASLLVVSAALAEEVTAPKESAFRKAGPPQCTRADIDCAVGIILSDAPHRFKVYSASDSGLNGRSLILAESIDPKDNLAAFTGKPILIEFTGVADRQLLRADVIGPASLPSSRTVALSGTSNGKSTVPEAPSVSGIDLSHWKVTLPVSRPGKPGLALEVTELGDFTMPPYFDVKRGSITFSASTDGARTSGSNYPRSELREMDGNGDEYEWTVAQGGTLSATLMVNEVPTRLKVAAGSGPSPVPPKVPGPGRVVVGQIHGPDDELCRLYYDNGVLFFIDDKSGEKPTEVAFALKNASGKMTNIPLGKSFSYTIDANAERLVVTAVVDGETYSASEPIGRFWPGKALYFKAGAYVQVGAKGSKALQTGVGTGSVTFTSIAMHHPDVAIGSK